MQSRGDLLPSSFRRWRFTSETRLIYFRWTLPAPLSSGTHHSVVVTTANCVCSTRPELVKIIQSLHRQNSSQHIYTIMLSKSGHSRCTATAIYLLSYLTSFAMATSTLRIITSNVRFDGLSSQPVPIPSNGTIQTLRRHWTLEDPYKERPWAERRSRLTDALMFWGPDVIGFQVSRYDKPRSVPPRSLPVDTWEHQHQCQSSGSAS